MSITWRFLQRKLQWYGALKAEIDALKAELDDADSVLKLTALADKLGNSNSQKSKITLLAIR